MKKIISWMLVLSMALSFAPMGLFTITAKAATQGDYTYTVENDEATITDYNGAGGDLTIPATLGGYPVTSIGRFAFNGCNSLTSVIIPDSVTSIGYEEFAYCSSLTSVTIPNSVTSIGKKAFFCCFSLTSVTIPNSVTSIGDSAFLYCYGLTSVTIGNGVTSIGSSVFGGCVSLTGITVDSENVYYSSDENGMLFNKDKTTLIQYPAGNTATQYTIPSSVTSIEHAAFSNCDSLTSVTIPNSVTSIGSTAFSDCDSLTSVIIPDSVTSIGEQAFWDCTSLTSVTIPNSVTSISGYAFYGCDSLTSVTIPNSVTSIGSNAFEGCDSLTGIVVDSENAYYSSDENGVLFNKDKTTLIQYPAGNTATEYTIPNSVKSIEYDAFYNCDRLTGVIIPNSVTSIGEWAFCGCDSLTSVTIPESITGIGSDAFSGCDSLTSVTIGNGVTSIGYYAFSGCDSLKNVYYKGTQAEWNQIAIGGNNDSLTNATIHYKPETPTDFKVSLADYNDVKLSWKAADGANRYYVYYRRAGKSEWKRAGITTSKSYTVKDLVAGGTYEFKVISYYKDNGGTIKGNATKVLTCSTTRNLKAPSKVTVKLYGYDDVKISWSKVTYAKGYKVYYKRSTAKSYSYVGFTTGTSIKKANLSDGVKYTFKVVPCTKVNGSYFADDSSKTATVTTLKAVSTLKVAKYTSSKVKVSWTDISGESGYQVIVTSDKAGKKVITSTATTGKSKVVTAKKGVTYYYKVRAYKTVDGKKIYAPWSTSKAYKLK